MSYNSMKLEDIMELVENPSSKGNKIIGKYVILYFLF